MRSATRKRSGWMVSSSGSNSGSPSGSRFQSTSSSRSQSSPVAALIGTISANRPRLGVVLDARQQRRLLHPVHLVEHQHPRPLGLRRPGRARRRRPRRAWLGGVDQQADDVGVVHGVQGVAHHLAVEPVERPVDAGGVVEDHLPALAGEDADDPVAGGLRLVGDDRQLLLQQAVHQGRLAGVGPADQRDGSGLLRQFGHQALSPPGPLRPARSARRGRSGCGGRRPPRR